MFNAIYKPLNLGVAIKRISKSYLNKHKLDHVVYVEKEILTKFPHHFIVKYYGQFQDEDNLCIIFFLISIYYIINRFCAGTMHNKFVKVYTEKTSCCIC